MKHFNVRTLDDLAVLLKVHPLEIQQVVARRGKYYRSFRQKKPNGAFRTLYKIEGPLKLLQDKIKHHILDLIPLPGCVHGGVVGRSVVSNALPHVGKDIVFCLDVKNFYPTVRPHIVRAIFVGLGFDSRLAEILADISTWDDQLPQGCSTSTALANVAMLRVDVRLEGLARQHGFDYTRWIDDLTISGSNRLRDFRRLIERIVREEGFTINREKSRIMHSGERQIVTGVVVNEKLNLTREERRSIRQKVLEIRSRGRATTASLTRVRGKVAWLSQVNPVLGERLNSRLYR